jgi:hypothetical protein
MRVRIVGLVALAVVAGSATLALETAGHATALNVLTVDKVVKGDDASDTTFTVKVVCGEDTHTLMFSADGDPDPSGSNVVGVPAGTTCTVTETADGGASSTSFACDVTKSDEDLSDCTDDNVVHFGDTNTDTATITVTNTFEPPTTTTTTTTSPPTTTTTTTQPPAATAVVTVQPTFTG